MDSLEAALTDLYETRRSAFRERWSRDLPFDELLFDRWDRATSLGFGTGSSIYHLSYVYGNVTVGQNTWIGPFTVLDGSGGLTIGAGCDISAGVHIYTHDTVSRVLSDGKEAIEKAPVRIGDSCHIGAHVVVVKGVTIGHHSVIGAGSFVNRDIPAYTVAVGTPCRPVGRVAVDGDGRPRLLFDVR
jgi:acetyltransferase-like isoleucine patch superfamily enzyme